VPFRNFSNTFENSTVGPPVVVITSGFLY